MVKQGQRAASRRQKQIKQRLKQRVKQSQRTIDAKQLAEFMLVRYGLTLNHHLNKLIGETLQRFLQELLEKAPTGTEWSVKNWITSTLQELNNQVPWQFYYLVTENWSDLQAFLTKELPAVPLVDRIIVVEEINAADFRRIVSRQLAVNFFLTTSQGNPALMRQLSGERVAELQASFNSQNEINWQQVSNLLKSNTESLSDLDSGTTVWLTKLNQLTIQGG